MKVVVRSLVSECDLDALPKTKIREIFELMCKNLLIFERWYFGIMYKGSDNENIWLDKSKKTLKDLRTVAEKLYFKVKYYPEDAEQELIENTTIEMFFAEVKNDIYNGEIFCPADTCVLLASYALQIKFGDVEDEAAARKNMEKQKLIPPRIMSHHKLEKTEWESSLLNMWKRHKGLETEDAMLEYLKLAQNLEMYGVTYFEIKNKKGTALYLGINSMGLDIYAKEDKLNPTISFPWSEIKNLKFKDRKFMIRPTQKAPDFTFFTSDPKTSKLILNLGIGNHMLYVRRRKPDTQEVVKMKEKAKVSRQQRENQKFKLNNERTRREEVELREQEYKATIENMQKELQQNKANLLEAQDTIRRLQQQLEELQRAKEELERQQLELKSMMERLEQAKNMEAEEKRALEEEIRAKQQEVQRIQDEVEEKDAETRRLQAAVEEARRREDEMREAAELERQRQLEEAQNNYSNNEKELESLPEGADNSLPEIADINERLQEEVKILQNKLNESRNETLDSDLDRIHQVNLREGRNKYKTLADIRRGNTVRRVEMFENM